MGRAFSKLGLFGSVAEGTNIQNSDLDLVIETNEYLLEENKDTLRKFILKILKQSNKDEFKELEITDLRDLYTFLELEARGKSYKDFIHWITDQNDNSF